MADKTETQTKQPTMMEELSNAGSKLSVVHDPPPAGSPGYAPWIAPAMTNERKEFLKRQFTPTGCSDLEFEFFLAYCERTGLDPVIKQAYLVERKQKVFKNGADVWVSKFEPMSAEAGMAARADAMPDFEGIDDGVVYEGDEFSIDYAAGTVVHRANPLKRGRIIGAWAHVHRKGRRVPITWLRVEERIQTKGDGSANIFWSKMTASQILKCSRAEQWRQAYPNLFAGEFVPEEMDRDEVDVTPPNAEEAARPTTDRLADAIKPTKAPSSPPVKVSSSPGGVTIDVQPTQKTVPPAKTPPPPSSTPSNVVQLPSQEAAAKKAAAPQPPDPASMTVFGEQLVPLGSEIGKLDGPMLLQLIALGESKIGSIKNAARAASVRTSIDAMQRERKRREAALFEPEAPKTEKTREPGEDDGDGEF